MPLPAVGRGAIATWLWKSSRTPSQPSKSLGTSSSLSGRATVVNSSPAKIPSERFQEEGTAPPARATLTKSPFSVSHDTNRDKESVCATVSRFFTDLFNPS